jgi:hypothetical protein
VKGQVKFRLAVKDAMGVLKEECEGHRHFLSIVTASGVSHLSVVHDAMREVYGKSAGDDFLDKVITEIEQIETNYKEPKNGR